MKRMGNEIEWERKRILFTIVLIKLGQNQQK